MRGWQAKNKRTCDVACKARALPENAKPPAMRVDFYCMFNIFSLKSLKLLVDFRLNIQFLMKKVEQVQIDLQ